MKKKIVNPSTKDIAFEITKFFETGGRYGVVVGDFDGQILSVGALQWNVGQGTLFPLIVRSWEENPQAFQEIFGQYAKLVLDGARHKDREIFRLMVTGRAVIDHWKKRWIRWAETFSEIQRTIGAEPYHQRARGIVETFDLQTTRSYAWAFDLAVQNGGMGRALEHAKRELAQARPSEERDILRRLTTIRETFVLEPWRHVYRMRKLAIINGHGIVYRQPVNLDEKFGLNDDPWWVEQPCSE